MSIAQPISAFELRRHLDYAHHIQARGADWYQLDALHRDDHRGDPAITHTHQGAGR